MKERIMGVAAFTGAAAFARKKEYLWPAGRMPDAQPHQIAAPTTEEAAKDFKREEHTQPYLEWADPPAADARVDACMILISGGAYECWCDVELVENLRREFTALGVQCVALVYRTPRPKGLPIYQSAWEDGQRAVRLVRSQAGKRGFSPDEIGVVSMSAGSHLATLLATSALTPAYPPVDELDQLPCHVNWAIPFALAYGMTDGYGTPNTRDGDAVDVKLDPCFRFDGKTCPMCLLHGGEDVYSPASSTHVYRQLRRLKIPAEVHLYPDKDHGAHGCGRAIEFMRQMGYLGKTAPQEDLMKRFPNDAARADYVKETLWPPGKTPSWQAHQCEPYIEWHLPEDRKTGAIQIVYSGGGYTDNDPDGFEVIPARRYLNAKGMTVVTLKYRTPRPEGLAKHTTAWQDLQRAVRVVRAGAVTRGLDPNRIGIMGSSAGGHLTLMGAASSKRRAYWPVDPIDERPCPVQWAVCIYPAYALTDGLEDGNSTGGNDDSARLAPEFSFDLATPPILFIHGDADVWAAMNSVKAWEQLRRMGIQGEVHTLARRDHCFQREAAPGTGSYTWLDRIWEFLDQKQFVR